MNEQQLHDLLAPLDVPVEPDPEFALELEAHLLDMSLTLTGPLHPAGPTVARHSILGRFALAVVVVAVTAVGIGLIRSDDPYPNNSGAAQSIAASLLFPAEILAGTTPEVYVNPGHVMWASGLVSSPSGAQFRIQIADRGGSEQGQGLDQRVINGHTFTVEPDHGQLFYVAIDTCARVVVGHSASGATPWNDDATAILEGSTWAGRDLTVMLPAGWESLGFGYPGTLVQLSYQVELNGTVHTVGLMQMLDSTIANLPGIAEGPLIPTTFDGHRSWTVESARSYTHLIWQDNNNAVLLSTSDLTHDQMKQVAIGLQHEKAADWELHLAAVGAPTMGTLPKDVPPSNSLCGPARITITE